MNPVKITEIQKLECSKIIYQKDRSLQRAPVLDRLNNKLELMALQKRRERKRYSIIHLLKILNNLALNDVDREFEVHLRFGINAKITYD